LSEHLHAKKTIIIRTTTRITIIIVETIHVTTTAIIIIEINVMDIICGPAVPRTIA
jgi:hypothetical protein